MANLVNRSTFEQEVESWLRVALENENLESFAVEILGNAEHGNGFLGDVFFIHLTGKTATGSTRDYDLVLKCGKRSAALRENAPIKDLGENEIRMYKTVFPALKAFQESNGIEDIFDSVPKCYGTHLGQDVEVIVLENLGKVGFELYDGRKPLTTPHMHMLVEEYGKWHAISAAFLDQHPKEFNVAAGGLVDLWKKFRDVHKIYAYRIEELTKLLEEEFDEVTRLKWRDLYDNLEATMQLIMEAPKGFMVISHGDCWNNNYMFKNDQNGLPTKVAMLDWQLSKPCNPVFDLAYFIYACVSEEDLKNFDGLLRIYHNSLTGHLQKLGSSPDLYPFPQLLRDWKKLGRIGVIQSTLVIKICLTDKEEVPDVTESVEQGLDFVETFRADIKDPTVMKYRMKYIIDHAVERDYI